MARILALLCAYALAVPHVRSQPVIVGNTRVTALSSTLIRVEPKVIPFSIRSVCVVMR